MFITYSGSTSGDLIIDLVNDTHLVTGNFTISSADKISFIFPGATQTSDLNTFQFSGVFQFIIDGEIQCNGTEDIWITWESDKAEPTWQEINFVSVKALTAGSSITFTLFRHWAAGVFFQATYTVANLKFENNRFDTNGNCIIWSGTVAQSLKFIEYTNNSGHVISASGTGELIFSHSWFHDAISAQTLGYIDFNTTAPVTFDNCFFEDIRQGVQALFHFHGKAVTVTITNCVFARIRISFFREGQNATLITDKNIVREQNGTFMFTCNSPTFLWKNSELQIALQRGNGINVGSNGGNFDNVALLGGSTGAGLNFDSSVVLTSPAVGGVADGNIDVTSQPYGSMDSVLNVRDTLMFPRTITNLNPGTPTANGIAINFDFNFPGKVKIVYGLSSVIVDRTGNVEEDLKGYKGGTPWFYCSKLSDVDTLRQGFIGNRLVDLSLLQAGKDYKYRVVGEASWGREVFVSEEDVFSTPAPPAITPASLLTVVDNVDGVSVDITFVPPVSAGYAFTQIRYKRREENDWTTGVTSVGDPGNPSVVNQPGLTLHTLYDFQIHAVSSSGEVSLCSSVDSRVTDDNTFVSEEETLVDNMAIFLATMPAFQNLVGATGDSAARIAFSLTKIFKIAEIEPARPFARISLDDTVGGERIAEATFLESGNILLEIQIDTSGDEPAAGQSFSNTIGQIRKELQRFQGSDQFFSIRNVSFLVNPRRANRSENEDTYVVVYIIETGI